MKRINICGKTCCNATYAHNTSPIPETDHVTPFFLMFRRHVSSPVVLSFDLSPAPLSQSLYAKELIKRSIEARKNFDRIKANLKRSQREYYDMHSRDLHVPDGKSFCLTSSPKFNSKLKRSSYPLSQEKR